MSIEKIEVWYKPLVSGGVFYHKYLIYTDKNGVQHMAHGGEGDTGYIETYHGRAWSNENLYADVRDVRQHDARELIIIERDPSEDLADEWADIIAAMDEIKGEIHDYGYFTSNSNSAVDTALSRAGLPLPQEDNLGENLSPASDVILPPAGSDTSDPDSTFMDFIRPILQLRFFPAFFDPPVSPLVLDMDGAGIELVALSDSQAMFDLDNDSFAQHTGWVAPDDVLLAIDRNGNGRIDDIDEVFGNGTVDGFTELAALDSNDDGTIDASDTRFGDLLLWRDANGNGRSEADELQSLADGGVRSIDLNATESDTTLAGHRISHTSSFTRTDETTETIVDAWFENDRHISAYLPDDAFTLHADVPALPELRGYGVVADLSIAMTLDAGLRQRVTDLVEDSDTLSMSAFRAGVEAMVLDSRPVPEAALGFHRGQRPVAAVDPPRGPESLQDARPGVA